MSTASASNEELQKKGRPTLRKPTIHQIDIKLDKEKLDYILEGQGISYRELHDRIVDNFGLDLSYKGFMSAIYNHSTWKLLYAYVIQEALNTPFTEFFDLVQVDKEKRKQEKAEFKRKYARGK